MAGSQARRDVLKVVREFAMLVVGVMVALSADSCWRDYQTGVEIESLLVVLESELEENRESLSEALASRVQLVDQNRALVRVVNGGPPFPPHDSLIPLMYSPLEGIPPSLSFGAYEVLLSRGNTEFVDADFLAHLASHVSASRRGQVWDDPVRQDLVTLINEVIANNGGFLSTTTDQFRAERGLPPPPNEPDFAGIFGNQAFQSAAAVSAVLHYNRQTWLEARLSETDSLLAKLR